MDNFKTLASLVLSGAGESLYEFDPRQSSTSQPAQVGQSKSADAVPPHSGTHGSQLRIAA